MGLAKCSSTAVSSSPIPAGEGMLLEWEALRVTSLPTRLQLPTHTYPGCKQTGRMEGRQEIQHFLPENINDQMQYSRISFRPFQGCPANIRSDNAVCCARALCSSCLPVLHCWQLRQSTLIKWDVGRSSEPNFFFIIKNVCICHAAGD